MRLVLASGSIVEDMQLGIELAVAGSAPTFCPLALVTRPFPTAAKARSRSGRAGSMVTSQ